MSLMVWIDEGVNLYVVGHTAEGGYNNDMLTHPAHETLKAINAHLDEVDDAGEYGRITFADLHRFNTLWVDPGAIEKEVWAHDDFAVTLTAQEDRQFADKGWVPVMTVELELVTL